jgi:hypothetical protein
MTAKEFGYHLAHISRPQTPPSPASDNKGYQYLAASLDIHYETFW